MTRHLLKFLLFAFLFISCEKNNYDSTCPTSFKVVPSESISQMRTSFSSNIKYLTTTLNEFGFSDCFVSRDKVLGLRADALMPCFLLADWTILS